MSLTAERLAPEALSPDDRSQLLDLMVAHYDDVIADTFACDLANKTTILLLRDTSGRVIGFTSVCHWRHVGSCGPCRVIFSGDTIIDRRFWGKLVLEPAWIRLVFDVAASVPREPWYWFLICKGPRTFRYLPVYFHRFAPSQGAPDSLDQRLAQVASARFPEHFCAHTGLISDPGGYRLKPELASLSEREKSNGAVRFFDQKNPTWRAGTELATLTPLEPQNLRPILQRWLSARTDAPVRSHATVP